MRQLKKQSGYLYLFAIILNFILIFFLQEDGGIGTAPRPDQIHSQVNKEQCAWCRNDSFQETSKPFEEKRLGLVDLNTFTVIPIILEEREGMKEHGIRLFLQKNLSIKLHSFPGRRYSIAQLCGDYRYIDLYSSSQVLCEDCLNRVRLFQASDSCRTAILNYSTCEIYPINGRNEIQDGDFCIVPAQRNGYFSISFFYVPKQ